MACPQHADRAFEQIVIEVGTVLEDILHAITTTPTPNPSPQGGGEPTGFVAPECLTRSAAARAP